MIAYARKIRPLGELGQFKASELFNWLFYISPIVFLDFLDKKLLAHLNNLTYGIRLLLESSSEHNIARAANLLTEFCRKIVEIHREEKIETINVHCVRHLADQVRRFGPLSSYSAMSFESANQTLGDLFTGVTSECGVICRRLLQKRKLLQANITDNTLKNIFDQLSGKQSSELQFSDEMLETETLRTGRTQYADAVFFNRLKFLDRYFDSTAYKRSKLANTILLTRLVK